MAALAAQPVVADSALAARSSSSAGLRPRLVLTSSFCGLPRPQGVKVAAARSARRAGVARASIGGGPGALTPELKDALDKFVTDNKVVLFMKGNKMFPQCGFSNTCVQILNLMNVPYETVNILEDEQLRQAMKDYSSWPTFPQLYIDGEFFGGCDITVEAFQKGELKEILERAMVS